MRRVLWRRSYSVNQATVEATQVELRTIKSFQHSISSNTTLERLKTAYQSGSFRVTGKDELLTLELNSTRSLPMVSFPKDKIFDEVTHDHKVGAWRKPATKWFRLGKAVLKIYVTGIRNNWHVYRDTRNISHQFASSKTALVSSFYRDLHNQQIEHRINGTSSVQLPLNRREFQEYYRRKEFLKVPAFLVLAIIFEEFLPIICYALPSIVPWNCLTPGAFKKLSEIRIQSKKSLPWISSNGLQPAYTSPYAMPLKAVTNLLTSFRLVSKWKAVLFNWSGNKAIPCNMITEFHQYVVLDDWYLLSHILSSDASVLSDKELVGIILERQLYNSGEDLNALVREESGKHLLIWRLFIYWSYRYHGTLSTGGTKTFSEMWGVNNLGNLNMPGSNALLDSDTLKKVVDPCLTTVAFIRQ